MALADEWRDLRTAAIKKGCDNDMAYANGIQDVIEEWLQEKEEQEVIKIT